MLKVRGAGDSVSDPAGNVEATLETMKRAGITATCDRTGDTWTVTATEETGHFWRVTADTGLQAITEMMLVLGFEDLD
jgi:hypothetical protein